MNIKAGIVCLCLPILAGCTGGYKTVIGGQTYDPVPLAHCEVLLHVPPVGTFVEIGLVTAKGAAAASDTAVYRKLQKTAADMGADAVIVGSAAQAYRGTTSGYAITTGGVAMHSTGNGNYSGGYAGNTTYIPPEPLYGLDVSGIAIKFGNYPSSAPTDATAQ